MGCCRFRDQPGHVCRRRDGRLIAGGDEAPCFTEARAEVADLARLRDEVSSVVAADRVALLLDRRSEWDQVA